MGLQRFALVGWLAFCAAGAWGFGYFVDVDSTPRVAIINAYEPEIVLLKSNMTVEAKTMINGVEYTTGKLMDVDIVIFLCGVSTVNAAMNTQVVLDHFTVTHIVFSGIAGGANPSLKIGDVVVAEQWGQYLEMAYAREVSPDEYSPPNFFTYPYTSFGFMFPRNVDVVSEAGGVEERFWFSVDADMFAVAQSVATAVEPLLDSCAGDTCLDSPPRIVLGGNGVSGPVYLDNAAFRNYTFQTFGAMCVDMETASTAMVAFSNGVPYIAFRSLSDLAGGGPGENEIGTFFALAADNSATVVMAFLEAWGAA